MKKSLKYIAILLTIFITSGLCSVFANQQVFTGKINQPLIQPTVTTEEVKAPVPTKEETPLAIEKPALKFMDNTGFTYDPTGKTDPFKPIFEEARVETKAKEEIKKRTPQSEIEMVDLSQLRLSGVLMRNYDSCAMVHDATGKGYIIHVGMYIGNLGGRVVDIEKDRVIVEEPSVSDLGEQTLTVRELVLLKEDS